MTQRITPGQIKKNNRQQIYNYIYEQGNVSQQDIAYALKLSRPTVATNLSALEEDGLICKNGQLASDQIGRKAVAYAIVSDYRIAIGAEIMRHVVKLIAVDLYGRKLRRDVAEIEYRNAEGYYEKQDHEPRRDGNADHDWQLIIAFDLGPCSVIAEICVVEVAVRVRFGVLGLDFEKYRRFGFFRSADP